MSEIVKGKLPAQPAMNALKHGLTARTVVLPGEDATVYEAFEQLFVSELDPVGTVEEFLAHRVAAAAWRLLRVERLEGALASERVQDLVDVATEAANQGRRGGGWQLPDAHRYDGLAKLARHEAAIERAFFRTLRALREAQEQRIKRAPKRR